MSFHSVNAFLEVRQRLTIRQVVEASGIKVNRKGQFICPFHNDTHPSASIKNDYFHCFVCGAGGDCISYTARMYGLKNFDACKRLNEEFKLGIEFEHELSAMEKMKAKREFQKRQEEQRQRKELERLIAFTGSVLAEWHRLLHFGAFEPPESIEYQRAMNYLTQAKYYLDCYDEHPEEFSRKMRREVMMIDRRIRELADKG